MVNIVWEDTTALAFLYSEVFEPQVEEFSSSNGVDHQFSEANLVFKPTRSYLELPLDRFILIDDHLELTQISLKSRFLRSFVSTENISLPLWRWNNQLLNE